MAFRLHSAFQQGYGDFGLDEAVRQRHVRQTPSKVRRRTCRRSTKSFEVETRCLPAHRVPLAHSDHFDPFYFYQLIHHCEVFGGYSDKTEIGYYLAKAKKVGAVHFQTLVSVDDPNAIAASGADFLAVHLHEAKELDESTSRVKRIVRGTKSLLNELEAKLGEPSYRDEFIVVFPLKGTH